MLSFISRGCLKDTDCAANITSFEPSEKASQYLKGYPFNFQECRLYPTGTQPNRTDAMMNGCLCTNHLVSPEQVVDANGNIFISCSKIEPVSTTFFIIDGIFISIHLYFVVKCLYIILYMLPFVIKNTKHQLYEVLRFPTSLPVKDRVPLFKQHAFICLFLLMLSFICFIINKISIIASYAFSTPDLTSPPGRQFRLSEYSYRKFTSLTHELAELSALHFTLIWMSTTPKMYSSEAYNKSQRWFRPLWYKWFTYMTELVIIVAVALLLKDGLIDASYFIAFAGFVLIYQFGLGCRQINSILRYFAKAAPRSPTSSDDANQNDSSSQSTNTTSKKITEMADQIDKLSLKVRIYGSLSVSLYVVHLFVFDINRNNSYVSATTGSNPRPYVKEFADGFFTALLIVLFNFLRDCIFGAKKKEQDNELAVDVAQKGQVITVSDMSPETINRLKNMKSDDSIVDSSLDLDKQKSSR